jgi:Cysteine synthase
VKRTRRRTGDQQDEPDGNGAYLAVREALYERIKERIGRTPLVEVKGIELDRGCRLFAKEEYRNPTASHYDREMWRFLKALEHRGAIVPGETRMLETTTGNSGAAFAWLCRVLGYPAPTIVMPGDMPRARIAQIESYGATVFRSPDGEYITGISDTFGPLMRKLKDEGWYCPKHWSDTVHCVAATRELGVELVENDKGIEFDYFFLALGNGGSARGAGGELREQGVRLIGVEPRESPIVAEYLGLTEQYFGVAKQPHGPHGIIGTGPFREEEIYANMLHVADNGWLESIEHPDSALSLQMQTQLMDNAGQHVGMSSAGCVWAVKNFLDKNPKIHHKTFGVIFYDPAWKYLN